MANWNPSEFSKANQIYTKKKVKKTQKNNKKNKKEKNTIFEGSQTLVGNLELERGQKRRRIIKNRHVRDAYRTHCFEIEEEEEEENAVLA